MEKQIFLEIFRQSIMTFLDGWILREMRRMLIYFEVFNLGRSLFEAIYNVVLIRHQHPKCANITSWAYIKKVRYIASGWGVLSSVFYWEADLGSSLPRGCWGKPNSQRGKGKSGHTHKYTSCEKGEERRKGKKIANLFDAVESAVKLLSRYRGCQKKK